MKLTLTQFVTLDGVSQGPGSPTEDTSDGFEQGGWLVPHLDQFFVQRTSQWLDHADGLLFGRRTYQASHAIGQASPTRLDQTSLELGVPRTL